MNYISLFPNLFTLNISNSYFGLHSITCNDIDLKINKIVYSLFDICVTLKKIPIIRTEAPSPSLLLLKDNPSKLIALRLAIHICNYLQLPNNAFFSKWDFCTARSTFASYLRSIH